MIASSEMETEAPAVEVEQVIEIAATVLDGFLGIPVTEQGCAGETFSRGCEVTISGAWQGRVSLYLNNSLAIKVAAGMFRQPAEQVTAQDCKDALAEMTNIVGGNLKALLPAPSRLSLPVALTEMPEGYQTGLDGHLYDGQGGAIRMIVCRSN